MVFLSENNLFFIFFFSIFKEKEEKIYILELKLKEYNLNFLLKLEN